MTEQLGFLDTNIFVHSIHRDDPHYGRCRQIIAALQDGSAQGRLDATIVYELTFILLRGRRFADRRAIALYVQSIVMLQGVQVENANLLIAALDRWTKLSSGFADAWLYVLAKDSGHPICTVNARDFRDVVNTY